MTGLYSADTDDLDVFVGRSGRDVAALGATADELDVGRGGLALLPLPVFVQSPTLDRYRSLVAFMGENGRFVADVSDALRRFGAHTSAGVYRADASLVDQALATRAVERLDALEQTLIDRGARPEVAAAVTAEVAAALQADPTLSFDAATRAGFAAHRGISLDEAARAERAFRLSPPEVAAVLDAHFDVIAARHGEGDQITIEDLQDAVTDGTLDPEARDVAYRLAADSVLFADFDVAMETDLSDEPLGNGFAWDTADGIIGRDDVAAFPAKDHQARILRAWHPLVETAAQGYDLDAVDSHASADDVTAFIEDEDIPVYVRLAVFDVYAERHDLTVTEREVLEQELAFDGRISGAGTQLDVGQGPGAARTTPAAPARTGGGAGRGSGGAGGVAVAAYAHLLVASVGFGWSKGSEARIARDGVPSIVHTDPLTRIETAIDPADLADLSPAEAKAFVASFAATGTPPPEGTDRVLPHRYLDASGRWRMSDTDEPVWPGPANGPLSPGQYVDLQGQRRWSDSNQLVEQFPDRSRYQDDDGVWRWADTGAAVDDPGGGSIHGTARPDTRDGIPRGFGNAADFEAFGHDLYSGLEVAGYDDVTAVFQGSAVTGESFRTGAAFDSGRESDFDIALASPGLLDRASSLGIGLRSRGTRTGPLTASQLQRLGLGDLAADLGVTAGRPVRFMIFESAAGAMARGPSIEVPR